LFEDIGFYKDGQLDFLYFCKWIKKNWGRLVLTASSVNL